MQIAIISDVHSNVEALRSVLADVRRRGIERVVCLGDVVGYNCFPHETLAVLRDQRIPTVQGNHDLMAIGELEPDRCGPNARKAIHWTRPLLTDEEKAFLHALPAHLVIPPDLLLVHSCLGDPVMRLSRPEDYVQQRDIVARFDPRIRVCFFGHTHVPEVRTIHSDGRVTRLNAHRVRLDDNEFHFVNPGSVGHPRGTDYRAQYASFDVHARTVQFHRVRYDVRKVARENARHGVGTQLGDPGLIHYCRRVTSKVTHSAQRVLEDLR